MADKKIEFKIYTADRMLHEGQADMIVFNTADGEIGMEHGHVALLTSLESGVMRIHNEGREDYFALHGGFATLKEDQLEILADECETSDDIDKERAIQAKERAESRLESSSGIDIDRAKIALIKAITRLETAKMR